MQVIENTQYLDVLEKLYVDFPDWESLNGKTFFISGATGMIGSFFVDTIMHRNEMLPADMQSRLIAVGRKHETAEKRFPKWMNTPQFTFLEHDVAQPFDGLDHPIDYFIHAASTSHPLEYSQHPISTITTNILGAHNMLELAAQCTRSRFLLMSSVEIYGENRGDIEQFQEDYCGYLNCNTLRGGYPEAKRVSEALCQAYIAQKGIDAVILRLPRCYGPTMKMEDSKAVAQFIKNGVCGKDIVLKSKGQQLYSFAYVPDAVLGLLWVLQRGETGKAYNLADRRSDIVQKDLAKLIADYVGTKVVFDLPDETERRGYSTATKALMDARKLRELGWQAHYNISTGIQETIDILQMLYK